MVEYTSWRSWDRCLSPLSLSFPFIFWILEILGKKAPPQMTTKIQYQRDKNLQTNCWNLSNKTVQEHRNHLDCRTWRNRESPVCPNLNRLCLTTTIFNLVKAVHNEPIDGISLCLQEVLQSLTAGSDTPRNWTNTNLDSQKEMKSSQASKLAI